MIIEFFIQYSFKEYIKQKADNDFFSQNKRHDFRSVYVTMLHNITHGVKFIY